MFLLSLTLWLHSMQPDGIATTFMEEAILLNENLSVVPNGSEIMDCLILYTAEAHLENAGSVPLGEAFGIR